MRMLFCNIGWMNHYNGQTEKDELMNGGAFVEEYGYGVEEFTFQNRNGYYYGGTGGLTGNMHIERIANIAKNAQKIENVLVVWVAKKGHEQNSRIVGWYKDATVYREFQSFTTLDSDRSEIFYRIKAKVEDSVLLTSVDRNFIMPRASKSEDGVGMGRSNIWYADKKEAKSFIDTVVKYIEEFKKKPCNFIVTEKIMNYKTNKKMDSASDYIDEAYKLSSDRLYRDALEYVNRAIDIDYKNEYAYNCKGNVLMDIGLYDKAIENYNKSIECNSKFTDPLYNIALTYGMDGNKKKGIEYFKLFCKKEPDDKDALYNLGILYMQSEKYSDAYGLFMELQEQNPSEEEYKRLLKICKDQLKVTVV